MIYICKAVVLPCTICDCACQACRQSFTSCCRRIGDGYRAIGDALSPLTRGPLAGYVIGTWLVMLVVGGSFGHKGAQVDCPETRRYCFAVVGMTLVHSIFAFYLQRRLCSVGEPGQQMSHKQIADQTAHLLMYDFGVCLYIFFFFGSVGYFAFGFSEALIEAKCHGPAWSCVVLFILYYVGVSNYAGCWMCTQFCCSAVESRRQPAMKGGAGSSQTAQPVMGMPVDQATPVGVVVPVGPGNV